MSGTTEVRLGDLAAFIRGITFKPDDVVSPATPGAVPCMRTKNVQAELDQSDIWAVPRALVKRPAQFLKPGDCLVSSANSWNLVGKCCWVPPAAAEEATFGGFVSVLRADPSRVDPRFLYRWFSAPHVQHVVRTFGRRTTSISNLDLDRCRNLPVPLPSLEEQRRIARMLDAADAVRAKRREVLFRSGELRRSWFLQTFASGAEVGWPAVKVENLVTARPGTIRTGPFGSQLLHGEFVDEGIAVLGIDNVVANEFRWGEQRYISHAKYQGLQRYTVHPGDLLITIMGTCGRAAIVPRDIPTAINTKHLCCITVDIDRCIPVFLHAYFLNHPAATSHLRKNTKGAIMSGLNMGIIKRLPVRLPPIDLQRQFASIAYDLDRHEERQRSHLAHLDALFASLQSRAFKGEL